MSTTLANQLAAIRDQAAATADVIRADRSASPITTAVVVEFAKKADKAAASPSPTAVIELEQAGDSAKVAAEADTSLAADTKQQVLDAHLAICMLKASTSG